ncbi:MAG: response regulator [Desulfobacterales bacterium]|nr:response regulator [Desulfobacterales bacterium]
MNNVSLTQPLVNLYEFINKYPSLIENVNPVDIWSLIEKINVYQIELELRNKELNVAYKLAEDNKKKYFDLYDLAPVGYFSIDKKGIILGVNITGADMLKIERKQLINQVFSSFIDPQFMDVFRNHCQTIFETKTKETCELILIRQDKTSIYVQMDCLAETDANGYFNQIRATITDISELKESQNKVNLSNQIFEQINQTDEKNDMLRNILVLIKNFSQIEAIGLRLKENFDFPYYTTNGFPNSFVEAEKYLCSYTHDGNLIRDSYGNPILECMCGNVLQGRIDSSLPFFTHHGSFWTNSTTKLLASTTEKERQTRTRNRCNGEGYESVALIPLRSGNFVIGLLQLNDHRTDMFTLEIIKFYEYISASIGIALHRKMAMEEKDKLSNQILYAQKMESIGTLTGGMAHEFNNLLFIIMGNAEMLKDGMVKDDTMFQRIVEDIYNASNRGADLIKHLLTFCQKNKRNVQPFCLNIEIKKIVKMLKKSIQSMVIIECKLAEDLYKINADINLIKQALMNLCLNAKDAMPEGGTLSIKTENIIIYESIQNEYPEIKTGNYILLTISDTGRGVETKYLNRIFDPFFTTKEVGKGTGLGLSIVYGSIKVHNGYIFCESKLEHGTTFKVFLPAVVNTEIAYTKPKDKLKIGNNATILAIDDELEINRLLELILVELGYNVITVNSCKKAIDIYFEKHKEIDLILLDLAMPGIDGKACLKKLIEFNPDVKVIIASGYSEYSIIKEVMDLGAKDYITKPFARKDLAQRIQKVLNFVSDTSPQMK